MTMPNAVAVQSSIARPMRAASVMCGRVFAWIGGTAISLVLGLGRLTRAIVGEVTIQFLMDALWFRWLVKFASWASGIESESERRHWARSNTLALMGDAEPASKFFSCYLELHTCVDK
jgi:hypothetical protein